MKYNDPTMIDQLANEYVMGTLTGSARTRFLGLLKYRRDIQARVAYWEENLSLIALQLEPVAPPRSVLRKIEQKISRQRGSEAAYVGGFFGPGFWRLWSGLTTVASVALLVILFQVPAPQSEFVASDELNHIGVVGDNQAPLWVISADLQTGALSVRAVNATASGVDKVFELWMLPNEGNPQSIGLLPVNGGSVTHNLPAGLIALLKKSKGLAVSIEPAGGSTTGLPTGEVIQTTKIWKL
jgi:anti-sigma-K factor RskA